MHCHATELDINGVVGNMVVARWPLLTHTRIELLNLICNERKCTFVDTQEPVAGGRNDTPQLIL